MTIKDGSRIIGYIQWEGGTLHSAKIKGQARWRLFKTYKKALLYLRGCR